MEAWRRAIAFIPGSRACAPAGMSYTNLLFHQRTLALRQRLGRIFRRDGRDQLVIVPWPLRFFGLLHLEQVGRDDMAAVGTQLSLAEHGVVSWDFLHFGDDL